MSPRGRRMSSKQSLLNLFFFLSVWVAALQWKLLTAVKSSRLRPGCCSMENYWYASAVHPSRLSVLCFPPCLRSALHFLWSHSDIPSHISASAVQHVCSVCVRCSFKEISQFNAVSLCADEQIKWELCIWLLYTEWIFCPVMSQSGV